MSRCWQPEVIILLVVTELSYTPVPPPSPSTPTFTEAAVAKDLDLGYETGSHLFLSSNQLNEISQVKGAR
jgi:hypothetical protein